LEGKADKKCGERWGNCKVVVVSWQKCDIRMVKREAGAGVKEGGFEPAGRRAKNVSVGKGLRQYCDPTEARGNF